jgi:hypothetical protein
MAAQLYTSRVSEYIAETPPHGDSLEEQVWMRLVLRCDACQWGDEEP